MPKRRAASRWLSPSTWQAWRPRAYSSTAFILTLPAVRTGRKIRRRLFTPPPRPDAPAASVRDFLSAAYNLGIYLQRMIPLSYGEPHRRRRKPGELFLVSPDFRAGRRAGLDAPHERGERALDF